MADSWGNEGEPSLHLLGGATHWRAGARHALGRQPDLVVVVQPDGGIGAIAGDVADLPGTERRLYPLADGELREERLPERTNVGERERGIDVRPLVTPIGDEDPRDAIEVCAGDLGDQTSTNG